MSQTVLFQAGFDIQSSRKCIWTTVYVPFSEDAPAEKQRYANLMDKDLALISQRKQVWLASI